MVQGGNTSGHISSGRFIRQRTSPRVYWLFRELYFERITVIVLSARDTAIHRRLFNEIRATRDSFLFVNLKGYVRPGAPENSISREYVYVTEYKESRYI